MALKERPTRHQGRRLFDLPLTEVAASPIVSGD